MTTQYKTAILTVQQKLHNAIYKEVTERKIALSIEEAADYTGIGRNTLRKLVEWKKLPVLKVGRKVLIKTDILEKFMEANEGRDLRDKGNVKAVTRNVAT